MMRPKSFRLLVAADVLAVCTFAFMLTKGPEKEPSFAHSVVTNIEDYRKENRTLPDPMDLSVMQELGILGNINGALDYQSIGAQHYQLIKYDKNSMETNWYYDSRRKKWRYGTPDSLEYIHLTKSSQP